MDTWGGYDEIEEMMTARANVYPIEAAARDPREVDNHPWTLRLLEVQPKPHLPQLLSWRSPPLLRNESLVVY